MGFITKIKELFLHLFKDRQKNIPIRDLEEVSETPAESEEQTQKQFEYKNVIFEKIKYLEQYIKIFSMIFPEEYNHYLEVIEEQKKAYNDELHSYQKGFDGVITFSIDPERDARRLAEVMQLESDVKYFVDIEVNFNTYKDKLSLLCCKLNQFYNALLNTKLNLEIAIKQMQNANKTLLNLLSEVKELRFFKIDSRKREELLDYVLYCDYVLFKSSLRCDVINSFQEYVEQKSQVYPLFEKTYLNKIIFGYLIDDLERLQLFLINNLSKLGNQTLIDISQELQSKVIQLKNNSEEESYFDELIRLENTLNENLKLSNMTFEIEIPTRLVTQTNDNTVNATAIYILNLTNNIMAKVLSKVIKKFKHEISWREFYFLCKVFEIDDDVKLTASHTIYDTVEKQFLKLDSKYPKYSDEYVKFNKAKLLRHSANKKNKKYIMFYEICEQDGDEFIYELEKLQLDYLIVQNQLYLNHSYFNGFVNLEENFCNIKMF